VEAKLPAGPGGPTTVIRIIAYLCEDHPDDHEDHRGHQDPVEDILEKVIARQFDLIGNADTGL
jgi:hypothetical protein